MYFLDMSGHFIEAVFEDADGLAFERGPVTEQDRGSGGAPLRVAEPRRKAGGVGGDARVEFP